MAETEQHPFAHHGRTGAMVRLGLVVFLWSLVTLSLYRFWGRARVRRALWGATTAWGDPLEYTGTGRELFLGFLLALVLVYLPIVAVASWGNILVQGRDPRGGIILAVLYPAITVLIGAGLYRARRYRLSRTVWRGIRGGQDGSAIAFGLMTLAVAVLYPLTLGWALPWGEMWLERYKLRHTLFGDRRFTCDATAGPVYRRFAMVWLAALLAVPAVGVVGAMVGTSLLQTVAIDSPAVLVALAFLLYAIILPLMLGLYAAYKARMLSVLAEGTAFGEVRFSAEVKTWPLFRLLLGNAAILLLSLGILRPWVATRSARFTCAVLRTDGEPDFGAINQSTQPVSAVGEGVVSVFDNVGEF